MRQFILVLYVYGRNQGWTDARILTTITSSRVFPGWMDGCKAFGLKITYSRAFSFQPERSVFPLNKKKGKFISNTNKRI